MERAWSDLPDPPMDRGVEIRATCATRWRLIEVGKLKATP